jgi:hypothetical protein
MHQKGIDIGARRSQHELYNQPIEHMIDCPQRGVQADLTKEQSFGELVSSTAIAQPELNLFTFLVPQEPGMPGADVDLA